MPPSRPARLRLPVKPSAEHLRKQAKRRAKADQLELAAAQHALAREYGCRHWAELMHVVETMLRGADQLAYVKYEMEALPKAANANDLDEVRAILASGEYTQHDLDLALARSVLRFDERGAIARLLLEHGADPDGQYGSGYGPIVFGCGECLDVEGLQFLLDAGADVTFGRIETKYGPTCPLDTWLGTYVRGRNEAKHRGIDILLEHGAFVPPEVTPEILAIHRGDARQLSELIAKDRSLIRRTFPDMPYGNILLRGATLLHCAVEFGEIACIDVILDAYRGHGDVGVNTPADVIDGIGGQTPIFHAINTNNDGCFATLEHLVRRVGQYINMDVRATWRSHGEVQSTPLTPLEYAEKAEREIDPKWAHFRPRVAEELALLRGLDRRAAVRHACARSDVDAVRKALDAEPALLTPELWPPAIYEARSLEMTRLLLDLGLDPNECSAPRKPLHLAADRGLVDVVHLLLERGARLDVVDGENITPYELMNTSLVSGENAEQVRQVLRDAGAQDTIFSLINRGEEEAAIRWLREEPALRDAVGPIFFTPLHAAARAGMEELVRVLLAMGAAVDDANPAGNTPLWLACQSVAEASKRIAVARVLLEAGANPRRSCEDGSTPLHFAAWRGPREMVELLIRHNAKTWQQDKEGKLPIDYARSGVAPDKDAIVHLLDRPVIDDPHFRAAVNAIHAGDLDALKQLLRDHPNLSRDRAMEPDCYLASDYFGNPKLLWFVANNPTLITTMPTNSVDLAQAIIDAGVEQSDLDYTLGLVMTSSSAIEQGLLKPLMDVLIRHGAVATADSVYGTLGHAMVEPVQVLLATGFPLTAPIAAALGEAEELKQLLADSDSQSLHAALSLAVINRQVPCAELCLDAGADINAFVIVHVHSTPAHQAAVNDDVPMLELLVSRGARLDVKDTLWGGTPLGWAHHTDKPAAEAYLRSVVPPA
jgi:ankyrin repeat protein